VTCVDVAEIIVLWSLLLLLYWEEVFRAFFTPLGADERELDQPCFKGAIMTRKDERTGDGRPKDNTVSQ
jgi:hypothetical protein